jgi:SAM-dependent methyltransferase
MENKELTICPICKSDKAIGLVDLDCGNLDCSTLYRFAKINSCEKCGHVYNRLSLDEIAGLKKYYNEEYAPTNINSTDEIGDKPGSNNQNTLRRYDQLYNLISEHASNDSRVLDIGCATGGFLNYLRSQGFKNLSGIDPTEKYIDYAKKINGYNIKLGSAESIPFNGNSFDLLIMDQVLEHLIDPIKAFREAKRVLADGGLFCVGVPDARRYSTTYFFDFYWFLLREHIQHFDIEHLKLLAEMEGFELIASCESDIPMMSEKMILPNLNVIFRLAGKGNSLDITENCFKLKKEIEKYIVDDFERLKKKIKIVDDFIASQKPLYVWGIGREFLYLYESAGLKKCNIVGLIDTNPYKRKTVSIGGRKIMDKSILKDPIVNSAIIISAIAHTDAIKIALKEVGFKAGTVDI